MYGDVRRMCVGSELRGESCGRLEKRSLAGTLRSSDERVINARQCKLRS